MAYALPAFTFYNDYVSLEPACWKPFDYLNPSYVFLSLRVISVNRYIAKKDLWIIELHNGQDSRLTHELINQGLKPALNTVEKDWRESWRIHMRDQKVNTDEGKGALIIVGRRDQDKFFSNGVSSYVLLLSPFLSSTGCSRS